MSAIPLVLVMDAKASVESDMWAGLDMSGLVWSEDTQDRVTEDMEKHHLDEYLVSGVGLVTLEGPTFMGLRESTWVSTLVVLLMGRNTSVTMMLVWSTPMDTPWNTTMGTTISTMMRVARNITLVMLVVRIVFAMMV